VVKIFICIRIVHSAGATLIFLGIRRLWIMLPPPGWVHHRTHELYQPTTGKLSKQFTGILSTLYPHSEQKVFPNHQIYPWIIAYLVSLRTQLDFKQVLNSICISNKKMKICGSGQSRLRWEEVTILCVLWADLYKTIFVAKSHRNLLSYILTMCAKWHSWGVKESLLRERQCEVE